ncbi:MAG TPA: hypothetical protein VMB26_10505 [Candidatus Binataceae bacterium]|nr:hypothetical protein [Candidatus Binataceae bacterium]
MAAALNFYIQRARKTLDFALNTRCRNRRSRSTIKPMAYLAVAFVTCLVGISTNCDCAFAASPSASQSPVAMLKDNPLLTPPIHDGEKVPVQIALRVVNLSDIDEVAQRFRVVAYLLASWKDPRLAFTPTAAWDKFRVYRPYYEVWTPDFDFANGVVPHAAFDVALRAFPDGTVRYYERSSAELSNTFHLHAFPFDRESLKIFIHPPVSETMLVSFLPATEPPALSIEKRVYSSLTQWEIVDLRTNAQQIPSIGTETTSEIQFNIYVQRRSNFYIWKVFLPLLLMVVLSWTVFWIDNSELNSQVTISVTTILTVIAFAFAISTNLPKVPYLTFIDVFFLTCYVFVFVTAVELTFVHLAGRSNRNMLGKTIRRYSRIALPVLFVLTNLVMIAVYFG